MITLRGKGVSEGIAFGKLLFNKADRIQSVSAAAEDAVKELGRLKDAMRLASEQLEKLYADALGAVGEKEAEIFQIHQLMLEDDDYQDFIRNKIESEKASAESAVSAAAENFAQMFSEMDDPYMQGRTADVRDVSGRLTRALLGEEAPAAAISERHIVAAEDITPSQALQLDKSLAMGFVTVGGSQTSHTAILARTMNVPAVIGVKELLSPEYEGLDCIADGFTGVVYIDPDEATIALYKAKEAELREKSRLLEQMKGEKTVTLSGQTVRLYANIGGLADIDAVLENDAEGVGLFRTEFIFLESESCPTEDEQFAIYKEALERLKRPVVFRTMDIGADKQAPWLSLKHEDNPALGVRGARLSLLRRELFESQLRALYRASAFGKAAIMFPMIISKNEVLEIKEIARKVQAELTQEGIAFDASVELGIMIETPAAVMISGELAEDADFFSIGTNDLTQYTLALDRQNKELDRFYDPHHPAVIRMIRMVAQNAHAKGVWVGICGELGADPGLTDVFVEMGIDELSVSPSKILGIRAKVRAHP